MNRPKRIRRITIARGGASASWSCYQWYSLARPATLEFIATNKELIAARAETIIPRTDTPGAKDCKVEDYITKMIRDCTERKTQNHFIDGLKSLKEYSVNPYNKEYQFCSMSEQEAI